MPGAGKSLFTTSTAGASMVSSATPTDMRSKTTALWALRFGNDHAAGPTNWLYCTAGISDEAHGLFGFLTPADKSASEAIGDER